jgi:inorganic triphosphatase YgiF
MRVTSREYKIIVDWSLWAHVDAALSDILVDVGDLAEAVGLEVAEKFDVQDPNERTIIFLDTPDYTLRENGLLLRQRVKQKNGKTEYTLKCRTEDRYIAAGKDLRAGPRLKHRSKLEEDVGVPFVSRFSHSSTVELDDDDKLAGDNFPETLSVAGKLFPAVLALYRDGMPCAPETALAPVNGLKVFERVFTGAKLHFPKERDRRSSKTGTMALILWSKGKKGRTLTAEFSFRCEDDNEAFSPQLASVARSFFEGLQHQDWTRPEALTKTQYMYGSKAR